MTWIVSRLRGSAGALHDRPLGPGVDRRVTLLEVTRPALVLGSAQRESEADASALAAFEVDLARRRSGGGAVLLVPGQTSWIDVDLPRGDALWDDDVGRAFHWLGRSWIAAVADLGVDATMHAGAVRQTAWSRRVCFGGLGAGEVIVDGRKLVGISQRRTRAGARFQCVVHRKWDPVPILGLLRIDDDERAAALVDLLDAGTGLDVDDGDLLDALVRHLPDD